MGKHVAVPTGEEAVHVRSDLLNIDLVDVGVQIRAHMGGVFVRIWPAGDGFTQACCDGGLFDFAQPAMNSLYAEARSGGSTVTLH